MAYVVVQMRILGCPASVAAPAAPRVRGCDVLRALRTAQNRSDEWTRESMGADTIECDVRVLGRSIVMIFPGFNLSRMNGAQVESMFVRLSIFQFEMIREGLFVRGAMAVGKLHLDTTMAFGRAVTQARDGERRYSWTPRILLMSSARKAIGRLAEGSSSARAVRRRMLLQDADGETFVNYLAPTIFAAGDGAGPFIMEMRGHRDQIVAKLNRFSRKTAVRAKYEWCAHYHNSFCAIRLKGLGLRVPMSYLDAPRQLVD